MQFRIDLRSISQRRIRIELAVDRDSGSAEDLEFFLPVWTPGSYLVREYSRHLVEVVATDGDSAASLPISKSAKNRYRVRVPAACSRVVLRYQVYAHALTVREAWVGQEFAYWNGACVYLWPVGREQNQARISVELPQGWKLFCGAKREPAESSFVVADLDEAVDTPCLALGDAVVLEFEALGCQHRFACAGLAGISPPPSLVPDTVAIIEQAAKIFGDGSLPFDDYSFLALFGDSGRGGLEHRNSSTLLAPRTTFAPRQSYEEFLALVAHEYLHVWNVKRMRPRELQRFDYERENYTRLLWVVEGVTSYYDDHVCLRAGIVDAKSYLETVAGHVRNVFAMPGRFAQSLAESSFDAWVRFYRPDENTRNSTQNYYSNGALAALCLDARIRDASQGKHSLDDAMRMLYERTQERGYDFLDVIECVSEAAGTNLEREIRDLVEGAFDPDLDAAFAVHGLELRWMGDNEPYLGVQFRKGTLELAVVFDETPAWRAGLAPGDEVLAIEGLRVTLENWSQILGQIGRADHPVELLIERDGRVFALTPTPERRARARVDIRSMASATEAQKQHRERWLGSTSRSLA